jgi:hypothetical protein
VKKITSIITANDEIFWRGRANGKLIGLGKLDAIRRMQRKGLSMEEIMDMGYTKAEYKQAFQTEKQLIEK